MRVALDGVVFQNGYQRGIQRAFRELIPRLPHEIEIVLTLTERAKAELPSRTTVAFAGVRAVGLLPRRLRRAVQPALAARGLARIQAECDVFESTYYTLPTREMPTVVLVHDMIAERAGEFLGGSAPEGEVERKRVAIEGATQIIAISAATADDLTRFYPSVRDRVTIVHWGGDHLVREVDQAVIDGAAPGADRPYVLHVGDRALYKNFPVLLDALSTDRWPSGLGLVVAGPAWKAEEAARLDRFPTGRMVRHVGRPDDGALRRLYAGAACVAAPSRIEGFGFSVLEAQSAGAPLVCADTRVFREIAAGGALYFDCADPVQLAQRVAETLEPDVRTRLINAGRDNLVRFSWERCAHETARVYQRAAAERVVRFRAH